jgi:hypothetical protein
MNEERLALDRVRETGPLFNRADIVPPKVLSDLDSVYWAGGEPFMLPVHWEVMDKLVLSGHTKIPITYNTNFTFPSERLFVRASELLQHFSDVRVSISLDGLGEIGEYLRVGWVESDLHPRLKRFRASNPHVWLGVEMTITCMGMLEFARVIKWCRDAELWFSGKRVQSWIGTRFLAIINPAINYPTVQAA